MNTLISQTVAHKDLSTHAIQAMYDLYSQYYEACDIDSFSKDMMEKDYVILLEDQSGNICGFSTLRILDFVHDGQEQCAIYSGDTIVHHEHWGSQVLLKAWCRMAGVIKRDRSDVPLYWFLIVKGYRTYRYLPLFTKSFFPSWRCETPTYIKSTMDYLAVKKFGKAYNADSGVICFERSQGHLKDGWAGIPDKVVDHKDVNYFLEKNPGYVNGDELVCLTELSENNLKSFAANAFCDAEES